MRDQKASTEGMQKIHRIPIYSQPVKGYNCSNSGSSCFSWLGRTIFVRMQVMQPALGGFPSLLKALS